MNYIVKLTLITSCFQSLINFRHAVLTLNIIVRCKIGIFLFQFQGYSISFTQLMLIHQLCFIETNASNSVITVKICARFYKFVQDWNLLLFSLLIRPKQLQNKKYVSGLLCPWSFGCPRFLAAPSKLHS